MADEQYTYDNKLEIAFTLEMNQSDSEKELSQYSISEKITYPTLANAQANFLSFEIRDRIVAAVGTAVGDYLKEIAGAKAVEKGEGQLLEKMNMGKGQEKKAEAAASQPSGVIR